MKLTRGVVGLNGVAVSDASVLPDAYSTRALLGGIIDLVAQVHVP